MSDSKHALIENIEPGLRALGEIADRGFSAAVSFAVLQQAGWSPEHEDGVIKVEVGESVRIWAFFPPDTFTQAEQKEAFSTTPSGGEPPCEIAMSVCGLLDPIDGSGLGIAHDWHELDAAFEATLDMARAVFGAPALRGEYAHPSREDASGEPQPCRYAIFAQSSAWVIVLQHFEGDAHCGVEATVDVRLRARSAHDAPPSLPLQTDLLL